MSEGSAPGAARPGYARSLSQPQHAPPDRAHLPQQLYPPNFIRHHQEPQAFDNNLKTCHLGPDYMSGGNFNSNIRLEFDQTYRANRSTNVITEGNMIPTRPQQIVVCSDELESGTVKHVGDNINGVERDSLEKAFVNYQFLEQSVSHQSIVNQSINILNQQVGVNHLAGDSDAPQFVHTADGVVLAVLPAGVSQQVELAESVQTGQSDQQSITVPLGWRRVISGSSVLYISPGGTALSTISQLREYLQTSGTCKCGLPCPLRPENTFCFDSKVASKPHEPASGAELTKLCNHKRKLGAANHSSVGSPLTPPPQIVQQKIVISQEKKKMKKRPNFPQMIVQRDRPLGEFKTQDEVNRVSPGLKSSRPSKHPIPITQNMPNAAHEIDVKQEIPMQKNSHYLTVSSGWISQHENSTANLKHNQISSNAMNVGLPVLGTNGQVIGVNTGYNKHANFKNVVSLMPHNIEQDIKDNIKDFHSEHISQTVKPVKENDAQMFYGMNQPLTPEVMQKINEQQQLFIQQNQKQIEMAMKGFRTQLVDNQNVQQTAYAPQTQILLHNGALVKSNSAKTPPWQVKRNDSVSNPMSSPEPKIHKPENDPDDSVMNISEESSGSNSSYQSNDQTGQAICPRVPPLPQQYNMMNQQWPSMDMNKKKNKNISKNIKKKLADNKILTYGNSSIRNIQESKMRACDELASNTIPSFMDDPNGYLAQQTVLLNDTISRQVGINASFDGSQYESTSNHYNIHQLDKCKSINKPNDLSHCREFTMTNSTPSPNNTPDSSMIAEKNTDNAISQCCKSSNVPPKNNLATDVPENQIRMKYNIKSNVYKMELDGSSISGSPRQGIDENPVTSSTFLDRGTILNESWPIQASIVSTSNETLLPPEPSPTPSNSSRSTDTPHSTGSNCSQMQINCTLSMPNPAYSNTGSCRDNFSNSISTPGICSHPYSSPGLSNSQSLTGTQIMHFISNHNVNKNLMDVDNISMVGFKPGLKPQQDVSRYEPRKLMENNMPGYCPPPHLGGGPAHSLVQSCYIQTYVTTMASGFSVTRDTVTSVLAGKANTATTSVNASQSNFARPPPPTNVNLATTYAIPNNQPDPFLNSVNLPTSYPLHIAGTTAQNIISKSPMEIVHNVMGNMPSKLDTSHSHSTTIRKTTPGQILISSTGQIIVSNNHMPPPPPKGTNVISQLSNSVTNVTASITQVVPAVGGVQSMVNQSTVVVNALQAPFVIQPPMMSVDGQMVVSGGLTPGHSSIEHSRQIDMKTAHGYVQGVSMLSPEGNKKRNKKKKNQTQNITNLLQIAAPQGHSNNIMVHHTSPQHNTSPQFSPRSFQLSPNNNIASAPVLQALTIVPGKSGTPAHIVMNGQGNSNNFSSQPIITNTSPSQQINLLQPVNLINNASGVVPNFQTFQQFIVPNLGGMVMTADGTALIQDGSNGMPVQLQLQTVNGQNVLTPVQNSGVFATGNNGSVVIRSQNQQSKIMQSQHSPGAQFLSPNSQVMVNSPTFNGQLSPLLANLSPSNVTFNSNPHQVNQLGQTLMVPLSPKQVSISSSQSNRANSTFVQQNTTIVQQQTTLVSNSHNAQMPSITNNMQSGAASRLSIDPNLILTNKRMGNARRIIELPIENTEPLPEERMSQLNQIQNDSKKVEADLAKFVGNANVPMTQDFENHMRHSVSTQTLLNQQRGKSPSSQAISGSSPPDTTTHSPLGALEAAASPKLYGGRSISTQETYADTTTKTPEPADTNSSAMVQFVSSSEQDMAESRDHAWLMPRTEICAENESNNMLPAMQMLRQPSRSSVESSEFHFNQNMGTTVPANQPHTSPNVSNYFDRAHGHKRKGDFDDANNYRMEKMMRSSYSMGHGLPKESAYGTLDRNVDKSNTRNFPQSGNSPDHFQRDFNIHNLGPGNDAIPDMSQDDINENRPMQKFKTGDLVWGPVKGYASWPGKLVSRVLEGKWRVKWFGGDKAPGDVEDGRLLTLSEGLEAHHAARTKHRKSRKLNTHLENAIQEAMAELDKKAELCSAPVDDEETNPRNTSPPPLEETPRKIKKDIKKKGKKLIHNKTVDNSRLRSAR